MSKNLRPIGTEFWYEYPPTQTGEQSSFLYRVMSHELVARYPGDKEGKLSEQLKPIKVKKRRIKSQTLVQCLCCQESKWEYEFTEWAEK